MKLDCHDFREVFLCYSVTDQKIRYLDVDTQLVNKSHHWYFTMLSIFSKRGLWLRNCYVIWVWRLNMMICLHFNTINLNWWNYLRKCRRHWYLEKKLHGLPSSCTWGEGVDHLHAAMTKASVDHRVIEEYNQRPQDQGQIYLLSDLYNAAFEVEIVFCKWWPWEQPTAGLCLEEKDGKKCLKLIQERINSKDEVVVHYGARGGVGWRCWFYIPVNCTGQGILCISEWDTTNIVSHKTVILGDTLWSDWQSCSTGQSGSFE